MLLTYVLPLHGVLKPRFGWVVHVIIVLIMLGSYIIQILTASSAMVKTMTPEVIPGSVLFSRGEAEGK